MAAELDLKYTFVFGWTISHQPPPRANQLAIALVKLPTDSTEIRIGLALFVLGMRRAECQPAAKLIRYRTVPRY